MTFGTEAMCKLLPCWRCELNIPRFHGFFRRLRVLAITLDESRIHKKSGGVLS